jgi:hypothetical protein
MRIRFCYFTLTSSLLLAGTGCGKLVKVEGTVLLDGKPLDNAMVVFTPASGQGVPAAGVTASNGIFRLTTYQYADGVERGEYTVSITVGEKLPTNSDFSKKDMTSAEFMALTAKAVAEYRKKGPHKLPAIPAAYHHAGTTPLRQRVPPDGKVVYELQSDDSPQPGKPRPRPMPLIDKMPSTP